MEVLPFPACAESLDMNCAALILLLADKKKTAKLAWLTLQLIDGEMDGIGHGCASVACMQVRQRMRDAIGSQWKMSDDLHVAVKGNEHQFVICGSGEPI